MNFHFNAKTWIRWLVFIVMDPSIKSASSPHAKAPPLIPSACRQPRQLPHYPWKRQGPTGPLPKGPKPWDALGWIAWNFLLLGMASYHPWPASDSGSVMELSKIKQNTITHSLINWLTGLQKKKCWWNDQMTMYHSFWDGRPWRLSDKYFLDMKCELIHDHLSKLLRSLEIIDQDDENAKWCRQSQIAFAIEVLPSILGVGDGEKSRFVTGGGVTYRVSLAVLERCRWGGCMGAGGSAWSRMWLQGIAQLEGVSWGVADGWKVLVKKKCRCLDQWSCMIAMWLGSVAPGVIGVVCWAWPTQWSVTRLCICTKSCLLMQLFFFGGHKCSIALSAGVFFFIAREVRRINKNWYVFMLFGVYAAIIFHWSVSIPILDPSNI